MILLKRFTPILAGILIAITFVLWAILPHIIYYVGGTLVVICLTAVGFLFDFHFLSRRLWSFTITPLLFLVSTFLFFLLIERLAVQLLVAFAVAVVTSLILHNVFKFLYETTGYQPYALENMYGYVSMATLFMFTAGFYGFSILLGWPVWAFTAGTVPLVGLLFQRTLWAYKLDWQQSKLKLLTVTLVVTETFYVTSLLPTGFLFNSLITTIVYYLLSGISRDQLRGRLDRQGIRQYVGVSLALSVAAFLLTRW
ncbi:MAG: hypothetical protein V1916_02760 [Patescibacteria group bacterium]